MARLAFMTTFSGFTELFASPDQFAKYQPALGTAVTMTVTPDGYVLFVGFLVTMPEPWALTVRVKLAAPAVLVIRRKRRSANSILTLKSLFFMGESSKTSIIINN